MMPDRCAVPSGAAFSLAVSQVEIYEASVSLTVWSLVLSARWAGRRRRLCLEQAAANAEAGRIAELAARVVMLADGVAFRDARLAVIERRPGEERPKRAYPLVERLRLLWLVEHYQIPKRRVKGTPGVARSSVHRQLKAFQEGRLKSRRQTTAPANKTPREIAGLIWDIFARNPMWGRHRIAMALWALGVFVSATTVRDILLRPRPPASSRSDRTREAKGDRREGTPTMCGRLTGRG
jgi:hypothetical protein